MAKTNSTQALLEQLKDPFPRALVKWRKGGGAVLPYIDARDVMKRLDEVVGIDGWQTKMVPVDGGFVCELSINISVDPEKPNWITKADGAQNTKVEPLKGGMSGALKRAAHQFGVGRALYYMDSSFQNMQEWPAHFLPGAPADWEKIAQEEAKEGTGMDQEDDVISATTGEIVTKINNATSVEELDMILENVPADQRLVFADVISNKREQF